jgi:hypothetical protein
MSADSVKQIIGRAVAEPEFRQLLLADPVQAVNGFELTEEEMTALKNLTSQEFDAPGGELEARLSRAGLDIGLPGDAGGDLGKRIHNALRVVKTTDQ